MERELISSFDGKQISVAIWQTKLSPLGIVQISHGLMEHIARYDEFATYLSENGYIVIGADQRGHGETDRDSLGSSKGRDVFEDIVKDTLLISETYSKRYNLPIILLGYDFGSFIARRCMTLTESQSIKGYILLGTAEIDGRKLKAFMRVARRKSKKKGDEAAKTILRKTTKKFDKKTKEGRNDWLTREAWIVGQYNIDPLCGFRVSYNYYNSFFCGILRTINSPMPVDSGAKILIVSGGNDMFSLRGKLVEKAFQKYRELGISPILKIYEGARHELLNEINREEIYLDILSFIKTVF